MRLGQASCAVPRPPDRSERPALREPRPGQARDVDARLVAGDASRQRFADRRADLESVAAAAEAGVVAAELLLADDRVPVLGDVVDAGVARHEGAAVVRL